MTLVEIAALFEERKIAALDLTGLSKDALHIYFGLALFLLIRLAWRRRGGWLLAWAAVLAMACGGEWLDMRAEASRHAIQPDAAHWHDIWNTMFWPTMLLLVGRWLQPRPKGTAENGDGDASVASGENAERRLEQA
jgi:hypothetical protein